MEPETQTEAHKRTRATQQMRSNVRNLPSLIRQIWSGLLSANISHLLFYMESKMLSPQIILNRNNQKHPAGRRSGAFGVNILVFVLDRL